MVDLNEYKAQKIDELLGVNPRYLNEVPILSQWGLDAIKTAEGILGTSYKSMEELTKDLKKLKSDVEDYLLWD